MKRLFIGPLKVLISQTPLQRELIGKTSRGYNFAWRLNSPQLGMTSKFCHRINCLSFCKLQKIMSKFPSTLSYICFLNHFGEIWNFWAPFSMFSCFFGLWTIVTLNQKTKSIWLDTFFCDFFLHFSGCNRQK